MHAVKALRLTPLAAAALLVACSPGGQPSASPTASATIASADQASPSESAAVDLGTVTLAADECRLDADSTTISGTSVRVTTVNETQYPGAFDMWRINDDRTYQDLVDHVAAEVEAASAGRPVLGHPGFVSDNLSSGIVAAGESARIEGRVRPGTFAIVCLGHFDAVADDPFRPRAVVGPIEVR